MLAHVADLGVACRRALRHGREPHSRFVHPFRAYGPKRDVEQDVVEAGLGPNAPEVGQVPPHHQEAWITLPRGQSVPLFPPNELVLLKLIESIHCFTQYIVFALVAAIAHARFKTFFNIRGGTDSSLADFTTRGAQSLVRCVLRRKCVVQQSLRDAQCRSGHASPTSSCSPARRDDPNLLAERDWAN